MALAELLEKVSGRLRQRQGSALDQLAVAATAHAAGKTVDIGAVEAALVDARLDIDDFKAMCEAAVTRLQRRAEFDALAAARTKADKVQGEIDRVSAVFEEARATYQRQFDSLRDRQIDADRAVERGQAARDWLVNPDNVPGAIATEYRAALQRQEDATVKRGRIERELREHRSDIRDEAGWVKQLVGEQENDLLAKDPAAMRAAARGLTASTNDKLEGHARRLARLEARVVELTSELDAADKELQAATDAVQRLQERILKAG